jgi:Xaa-Pro dipeptidase
VNRLAHFQERLLSSGVAAALITSRENVRYFTGYYTEAFNPFTVTVVPAVGQPVLLTLRQDESLARTLSEVPVVLHELAPEAFKATAEECRRILEKTKSSRGVVGLEFGSVALDRFRVLEETLPECNFSDISAIIAALRLIKDPQEQLALRCAAQLATVALKQATDALRPGVSEVDIKTLIDRIAYVEGARRWPEAVIQTETNVLTGPKANRLHDFANGRILAAGETAFILAGVSWNGYWGGDVARTLFVPDGDQASQPRRFLDAAIGAQRAAIKVLGPGQILGEAARAAESELVHQGLLDRRAYRMFRGIGLTSNERPSTLESNITLEPGMCICVQVYLRSEESIVGQSDSVLITDTAAELLTDPAPSQK